jgi:hypothetical protein
LTRQPSRPRAWGLSALALVVLAAGVATAIVRHGDGSTDQQPRVASLPSASPSSSRSAPSGSASTAPPGRDTVAAAAAATGYYAAVKRGDARAAYRLLCERQRIGYASYAARVARNTRTGTGIASFRITGDAQVRGALAAVPGQVNLDDGETTPIVVLLVDQSGDWQVCSSDLGGVLPAPGRRGVPSPSQSSAAAV